MNTLNIAVIGAFLMEGIHAVNYTKVLEVWDQGALELAQEIGQYADLLENLYKVGFEQSPNKAGVFDYEVTSTVGEWFAREIIEKGKAPNEKEVVVKIIYETLHFFKVDEGTENQEELDKKLEEAVMQTVESWIGKQKQ